MEHPEFCAVFSGVGNLPIPDDLIDHLNEYVYCMAVTAHKVLTSYNPFKTGKCSDDALPPNSDCLMHHIARSNFQAASWN